MVPPPGTAERSENAAWYLNVFFVGYKCDLGWNVGLVRSSRTAAGLFAPAAESFSYGAIKSSFRCDATEFTWDGGERLA